MAVTRSRAKALVVEAMPKPPPAEAVTAPKVQTVPDVHNHTVVVERDDATIQALTAAVNVLTAHSVLLARGVAERNGDSRHPRPTSERLMIINNRETSMRRRRGGLGAMALIALVGAAFIGVKAYNEVQDRQAAQAAQPYDTGFPGFIENPAAAEQRQEAATGTKFKPQVQVPEAYISDPSSNGTVNSGSLVFNLGFVGALSTSTGVCGEIQGAQYVVTGSNAYGTVDTSSVAESFSSLTAAEQIRLTSTVLDVPTDALAEELRSTFVLFVDENAQELASVNGCGTGGGL